MRHIVVVVMVSTPVTYPTVLGSVHFSRTKLSADLAPLLSEV